MAEVPLRILQKAEKEGSKEEDVRYGGQGIRRAKKKRIMSRKNGRILLQMESFAVS